MWRRWWEYWRRRWHRQPRHHSGQLHHYHNGHLRIDYGYGHRRPHRTIAVTESDGRTLLRGAATRTGPQRVSFGPRPPPRVFKGLHGSNVKAIIKP
jgi:hypothetical protein